MIFIIELTISASISSYISSIRISGKSPNTIIAYTRDMKVFSTFINEKLNNKILYTNQIKNCHLQQFKEYLINDCSLKMTSAARKYNCLRAYLRYLSTLEAINNDLILFLNNDSFGNRARDRVNEKINIISDDVVKQIIKNINNSTKDNKYRDKCILFLLIFLGIRRADILRLKWNNINLEEGTIYFVSKKTSRETKIKLNGQLIDALSTYKRLVFSTSSPTKNDYVFPSINKEGHLSITAYNNIIKIYTKGLTNEDNANITGHNFRHSFVTNCIRQGFSLNVISKITGTCISTLQAYTHLQFEDTIEATKFIEEKYLCSKV